MHLHTFRDTIKEITLFYKELNLMQTNTTDKKNELEEYLIKEKMRQYHNVISQFSKYSFGIKQMFVTTLGVSGTIVFTILSNYDNSSHTNRTYPLAVLLVPFLLTLLFLFIDCTTYYYQDLMQENLYREEKKYYALLNGNKLDGINISKELRFQGRFYRICRSIFSISNWIYYIVLLACILAVYFIFNNIYLMILFILVIVISIGFVYYKYKQNKNIRYAFISYTTKGQAHTKEQLIILKKHLWNEYKLNTYIDLIDNPKNGKKFQDHVKKQIKKANLFILLKHSNNKNSEWVKFEKKEFLKTKNKDNYYDNFSYLDLINSRKNTTCLYPEKPELSAKNKTS